MISIVITSYKEPNTIARAIKAVAEQKLPAYEIIVVAPDDETLNAAKKLKKKIEQLKTIKDKGKGKPAALNLVMKKAKGEIVILTDGDVYVGKDSISMLLKHFNDKKVGAVTGRPVSIDSKNTEYGFWAHLLTSIADEVREDALKNGEKFFCSGYLFAIRKNIFPILPEELLAEDGFISEKVYSSGHTIAYEKNAIVYVKYPDNFKDWIKQKRRSAGGYNQIRKIIGNEMRSFGIESKGAFRFLKYVHSPVQFLWLIELFAARLYLWLLIYRDVNLKKKSQLELWERVESTK